MRKPNPENFARAILYKFIYKTKESPSGIEPSTRDHWLKCLKSQKKMQALKEELKKTGHVDDFEIRIARCAGKISRGLNAIKAEARLKITKTYLLPMKGGNYDYDKMSVSWAIKLQKAVFGSQNSHSDLLFMGPDNRTPGFRREQWEPEDENQILAKAAWAEFKSELKSKYNANKKF